LNYKRMFESVFESADKNEIGCFLGNTEVPFSYCERALKEKRLDWKNKLKIAMRSDCPDKCLVSLCRSGGEKFRKRILLERENIPEDALRVMWNKGHVVEFLYYWRLPDDLKKEAIDKLLKFDDKGNVIYMEFGSDCPLIFMRNQHSMPDGYAFVPKKLVEYFIKQRYDYYDDFNLHVALMDTPLDEKMVSDNAKDIFSNKNMLLKLAANPSISDYMIMQLKVKTPSKYVEDVDEVLADRRQKRDEYRQAHGIELED